MQHCSMTTLVMTKRGGVTLPPAMRKRMGLDRVENPLLIAEERDGGIFLQPATALPVRDLTARQIRSWIKEDEAGMAALRPARKKKA